jgi:hypothetical protein
MIQNRTEHNPVRKLYRVGCLSGNATDYSGGVRFESGLGHSFRGRSFTRVSSFPQENTGTMLLLGYSHIFYNSSLTIYAE